MASVETAKIMGGSLLIITMHFVLRASDVSALCGFNTYRSRADASRSIVEANVPSCVEPPAYRDVLWELEELIRSGPVYTEALTSRDLAPPLAREAERESMGVYHRFVGAIPPSERRRVRNHARTLYLKDRGLVMEVDTLRRLEGETGVVWVPTDRRRRFFTRTFVGAGGTISYTINGSVDGFEDGGGLLEVKNRRDRVCHHQHDVDQIIVYMVLSGLESGRLVQNVGGRIDATFIVNHHQALQRWNDVLRPALEATLVECVGRVREAAEDAMARWRPFTISHVVSNPPPQQHALGRRSSKTDQSTQTSW